MKPAAAVQSWTEDEVELLSLNAKLGRAKNEKQRKKVEMEILEIKEVYLLDLH